MLRTTFVFVLTALLSLAISGCKPARTISSDPRDIAKEMEETLTSGMMDFWYPRCVDQEFGGYLSNFDREWKQMEKQQKFIVTQARHTWASAQMAKQYPEEAWYREVSKHGYMFLRDVMWDKEYGGFYTQTDREGKLLDMDGSESTKIAYGNAFAIYGLAAYFEISHDSSALDLAIKSFHWLDKNSHDTEFGGYFQFMNRDGTPMVHGLNGTPPKDQNSSIHILEGLTELYRVWKDDHLKSRIHEMLVLIRDTITTEKGYMNLFFHRDWTPVLISDESYPGGENKHRFDHISFGHDIETAYLLLEASETIGIENDQATHIVSKRMCDHTIRNGWDPESGATYEAGYYFESQEGMSILEKYTQWWAATESFHTLLLMSKLYPDDPMDYYEKFTLTWDYCKNYLIDREHGGWYRLGINESPESVHGDKGGIWKGNYHNTRSLINCINLLKSPVQARSPTIDSAATRETIMLFHNLKELSRNHILFGHQDDPAYGIGWAYEPGKSDSKLTSGSYPAVYGWELGGLELGNPKNLDDVPFDTMRDLIIESYLRGGVTTISWHEYSPLSGKDSWADTEDTVNNTVSTIIPGGTHHRAYREHLDRVAVFLNSLKTPEGVMVPVIFRPFHENTGDWFWWGRKHCTPEEYKALFQFTVSYLRDEHRLHHLLYCYAPSGDFSTGEDYLIRYPGDDFVDMLGFDHYRIKYGEESGVSAIRCMEILADLAEERKKLYAFTETGDYGLKTAFWFTQHLLPCINASEKTRGISYVLVWRNEERQVDHFFVPYEGHEQAGDFKEFRKHKLILFENDIPGNLYQKRE